MGATAAVHPNDQTLQTYGLGKLDDDSAQSVTKHLSSCPECQSGVAHVEELDQIHLVTVYGKDQKDDLTADDKKLHRQLVDFLKNQPRRAREG